MTHPAAVRDAVTLSLAATPHFDRTPPSWRMLAILSLLMGFASISTDLYLPAMPAMGRSLRAGAGAVEWTVSSYLVGFQPGPAGMGTDRRSIGRRLPVAVGIVPFIVGSAGCGLAGGIWTLTGWRIVQAVGACAGVVLARAMVRDLYAGEQAAKMLSMLMTIMAVAPLIGPLAGGQILVLAVGVQSSDACCSRPPDTRGILTIPESLPADRRNGERLVHAFARYGELLRHRAVLGYAGAGGFLYGGMFAYIAGTPFAYIGYYHLAPQLYGVLFAVVIIGIMATNLPIRVW